MMKTKKMMNKKSNVTFMAAVLAGGLCFAQAQDVYINQANDRGVDVDMSQGTDTSKSRASGGAQINAGGSARAGASTSASTSLQAPADGSVRGSASATISADTVQTPSTPYGQRTENDPTVQDKDEVGMLERNDVNQLDRRRKAKNFSTFGLGPASIDNIEGAEGDIAYNVYGGEFWEVNRHAAIKAQGNVTSDLDNAVLVNLGLGANAYALPTDFTPYVGGDLGLGYGYGDDDNAFGFNAGASIGALLFRTSSAQLNLEGKTSVLLNELGDEDSGYPVTYSARLGILF